MSKFRRGPVVIEAFRWTGGPDQTEDPEWAIAAIKDGRIKFLQSGTPNCCLEIKTLDGNMIAISGNWIIQGMNGEIYPCQSDIFEATYEPVEATEGGERE